MFRGAGANVNEWGICKSTIDQFVTILPPEVARLNSSPRYFARAACRESLPDEVKGRLRGGTLTTSQITPGSVAFQT